MLLFGLKVMHCVCFMVQHQLAKSVKVGKIVPASPVNIVGRIVSHDNHIVNKVKNTSKVVIKQQ